MSDDVSSDNFDVIPKIQWALGVMHQGLAGQVAHLAEFMVGKSK